MLARDSDSPTRPACRKPEPTALTRVHFSRPERKIRHRIGAVFVVESSGARLSGFLECGPRAYADGCSTSPVGYIEGWWVDPDSRGQGVGSLLVSAAEAWARSRGYTEMASDAKLGNALSQRVHKTLGYVETQRVVCYRKQL